MDMSLFDFNASSTSVDFVDSTGRHRHKEVVSDLVVEVPDVRSSGWVPASSSVRIISCGACWGEGMIGDLEGRLASARVALRFGGDNVRVCPLCGGSGRLAVDRSGDDDKCIRVYDECSRIVPMPVREKIYGQE